MTNSENIAEKDIHELLNISRKIDTVLADLVLLRT